LQYWRGWIERQVTPREQQFERVAIRYLSGAKGRYKSRLSSIIAAARSYGAQETKAIDWVSLLARSTELGILRDTLGRFWYDTWVLTGNEEIDNIYQLIGRDRPLDFMFGDRPIADRSIGAMVKEIQYTTEKKIKKLVRSGIEAGKSNQEIAEDLERSAGFRPSRARLIAQTETTSAINRATNHSYIKFQEEEDDVKILKQWIASGDDNVRPLHERLADRDPIPVNDDFRISGYVGPAPAAFGNAPEMNCNCRCTIAPIVEVIGE
jgi:hypothetical protein